MNDLDALDFLETDEMLLWKGKPKSFHILEGTEGRELVFIWAVCLIWLFILSLLRIYNGMNLILLLSLVVLLGWILLNPVATYFKILRQHYYLTNKRALVIGAGGESFSVDIDCVKNYRIYKTGAGGATLVMGDDLLAENGKQLRYRAIHPAKGTDSNGELQTSGIVFYHAEHVDVAARILEKMAE